MSDTLVKQLLDINRNYDLSKSIHCTLKEAVKRIEKLEDQLSEAVEALRNIAVVGFSSDPSVNGAIAKQTVLQARDLLAEIEKGN